MWPNLFKLQLSSIEPNISPVSKHLPRIFNNHLLLEPNWEKREEHRVEVKVLEDILIWNLNGKPRRLIQEEISQRTINANQNNSMERRKTNNHNLTNMSFDLFPCIPFHSNVRYHHWNANGKVRLLC